MSYADGRLKFVFEFFCWLMFPVGAALYLVFYISYSIRRALGLGLGALRERVSRKNR
jgi:hypothetical protein